MVDALPAPLAEVRWRPRRDRRSHCINRQLRTNEKWQEPQARSVLQQCQAEVLIFGIQLLKPSGRLIPGFGTNQMREVAIQIVMLNRLRIGRKS